MNRLVSRSMCALLFPLALVGCGEDDGGGSGDGSDGSESGTATIVVSGTASEYVGMSPLVGAEVCLHDMPSVACVTTDAEGGYSLAGVPAATEGAFTLAHPDTISYALWGVTPTQDATVNLTTLDTPSAELFVMALGGQYDASKAHFAAGAIDGMAVNFPGVTFAVTPMPAGVSGYLNDGGIPDLTLTETSLAGLAGYANAEAGDYEISASHATATCSPADGNIAGAASGSIRIPAMAGYLNGSFAFVCQ